MVSELPTRPRVLILDRSVNQANHRAEIVASMARHTDAQVVFVQGDWQSRLRTIPERRLFDAIVWKQKFADLVRQEPIDWAGYRGLRVLFDLDTIQNYSTIAGADMLGKWVSEFRRHKFDLLITTGKELQRRFMADGVTSCWLPKAFDPKRVAPSECPPSRQYCYYG
jgi:hypothetical protein